MRINNNMMAMNTHRQLGLSNAQSAKSMGRLSSGMRINNAADDAAGLAISEKMRGQVRGLMQASRNAQDGISLVQTAEGALSETHTILQRMRELAVQSATDTNTTADRAEIQKEADQLAAEITRIGNTTEFNTQSLMKGTFEAKFHIGANSGQNMEVSINDMRADALGVQGVEGFSREITAATTGLTVANTGVVFDATAGSYAYTAGQLSETVTAGSTNYDYALKNADGNVVALSTDGQSYQFLSAAGTGEDVGSATLVATAVVDFGAGVRVTGGDVAVTTTVNVATPVEITSITAVASEATVQIADGSELLSGEYTVVGNEHALINGTDVGLLNNQGDLIGTSTNGLAFVSAADSGQALFTMSAGTGNALAAGDTVSISGGGGIDVSTQASADVAISSIDEAIATVSAERSKLGAVQNRLDHTIANLGTASENLQAAESRIRDLDMAAEMMEFTKSNILQQAATAMLAQANMAPQSVLQLLG